MRKLTTEGDGRALAISMVRVGARIGADETRLYPEAYGEHVRNGRPQKNFALRYLMRLTNADNEAVYRGFASVLSDVCGWAEDLPEYAELERQERSLKA